MNGWWHQGKGDVGGTRTAKTSSSLIIEFLAADVAVDTEDLGLSVPLASRVGCKARLGKLSRLFFLRVLLEAIWTYERCAGTPLRLVELQMKTIKP